MSVVDVLLVKPGFNIANIAESVPNVISETSLVSLNVVFIQAAVVFLDTPGSIEWPQAVVMNNISFGALEALWESVNSPSGFLAVVEFSVFLVPFLALSVESLWVSSLANLALGPSVWENSLGNTVFVALSFLDTVSDST